MCIRDRIEGIYVPVADFRLAAGDSVYFAHHVLLWKDAATNVTTMPLKGAWKRMFAGMPLIMTQAEGPGHLSLIHILSTPTAESFERLKCPWCQSLNVRAALACQACGAPLDVANLVSESGWRECPRIRDMTEIHFSNSTCQVEGEIVPVAEINLSPGDAIFFEHHVMLWKDGTVPLTLMPLSGGLKRAFGGMPFLISVATGPGRIAFSRDATGELVVLPLHPGMEVDVREHAFLLSSHQIQYSFVRIKGLALSLIHILWNYHDDDQPAPASPVRLSLAGLPAAGTVLVEHYRIDEDHSNAYTVWQQMGSPQKPTAGQYASLEAAGQLQLLRSPEWLAVKDGKLELAFSLPRQSVSLVTVRW